MTLSCASPIYSKTNEWTSLKEQFDALVHDENMREGSTEMSVTGTFVAGSGNGFRGLQVARREALAVRDYCYDKLFSNVSGVCHARFKMGSRHHDR